ncbi:MAG: hypothetical protein HDQ97_01405 [Lachnospiraceae bacterium]|nr:hypothetical protein [Lachnospiraceae bacterium]
MFDGNENNLRDNAQYVTNIAIETLSAEKKEDGLYSLCLTWSLNGGRFHDSDAKYEVNVFYGGVKQSEAYAVTVDKIDDCSGTVSGMKLDTSDKEKPYTISLIYSKDSTSRESDVVEIPIYELENLTGEYFDSSLNISWDKSFNNYPYIFCRVYRDKGIEEIYEVPKANTNIQVSLPKTSNKLPINADIYSTDGDGISGIVQKLRFFPQGIALTSFDREEDSLNAEFYFSCSEEESKNLSVYFCILKDNTVLKRSEQVSLTPISNGRFKVTLNNFFAEILQSCVEKSFLGAVIEYRNAKTVVFSGAACLPLAAPVLKATEYLSVGVRLTVEYPLSAPVIGFWGNDNAAHYSKEIDVKCSELEVFGVRPIFSVNGCECRGVSSDKISVFRESFFIETANDKGAVIYYRQNSGKSDEAVCEFSRELFLTHLTTGISSENNIITLEPCTKSGALYTLKLDNSFLLSADNNNQELNGFYKKLFGIDADGAANNITPMGFYLLSDAVSRMCRCKLSDVCALYRNFIPESRYCAVLPGDILRIETSVYTEQTDSGSEDVSGYTLTNTIEYNAALSGSANSAAIVFDSFVSSMSKGMNFTRSAETGQNCRLSGMTDVAVNVENPYLYLVYPINYYSSDMPASVYPYDNAFLIGNINYSTLLDELNDITEYPEHSAELDGVAYFNGRSSVTILIPVCVNEVQHHVPVGTSIYELLTGLGYYGAEFKLFRLNANREYCPVFIEDGIPSSEIILISGDKIDTDF